MHKKGFEEKVAVESSSHLHIHRAHEEWGDHFKNVKVIAFKSCLKPGNSLIEAFEPRRKGVYSFLRSSIRQPPFLLGVRLMWLGKSMNPLAGIGDDP